MSSSAWLELWVTVAALAHVLAAVCLFRSSSLLRHRSPWALLGAWLTAICQRRGDATGGSAKAGDGEANPHAEPIDDEEWLQLQGTSHSRLAWPHAVRPVVLAWHQLSCAYPAPGKGVKYVLQGAVGSVRAGDLVGVLGPSGGGKSTLLEILAGHKAIGALDGAVGLDEATLRTSTEQFQPKCSRAAKHSSQSSRAASTEFNGTERLSSTLTALPPAGEDRGAGPDKCQLTWRSPHAHALAVKRVSAFVAQDTAFHPSLTASEVLSVHASLLGVKQGRAATPEDGCLSGSSMSSAVASALDGVGLSAQAHTLVGGPLPGGLVLRGLSGGERRRLAVAAGLLASPSLLLLDEPTSGLDASTAVALMRRLARLCRQDGLTVLCSLHQPRAAIWNMLDTVVVVSYGYTVYGGPPAGLLPWLTGPLGFSYSPEVHGAPSDWAMDLVNISFDKEHTTPGGTLTCEADLGRVSALYGTQWTAEHSSLVEGASPLTDSGGVMTAPGSAHSKAGGGGGGATAGAVHKAGRSVQGVEGPGGPQGASWWRQVAVLSWREAALQARNPADLAGRLAVFCWAGLVIGLVFYGLLPNIQGLQLRCVVLYVEVCVLFLLPFVYMSLYTSGRPVLTSEMVAGLYPPSAYYASKALLLTGFSALNSLVLAGVVYGMSGLAHAAVPLVAHLLIATLGYLTAQQVLYCAALITPNQDAAFMIAIVWTAVNILLANYPIRVVEYTMTWVAPLRYVSAMYYTYSGLLSTEFRHTPPYTCANGLGTWAVQLLPSYLPGTAGAGSSYVQSVLSSPGEDCSLDPAAALAYFSVDWAWGGYAGVLVGYLGVVHGVSLLALLWASRRERR